MKNIHNSDLDVLTSPDIEAEIKALMNRSIILFNDNHNSFDHVISCLIDYCEHHPHQAEQCAYIVHHNGKCQIKTGSYDELVPIYTALCENDLTVEIQ